MAHAPLGVECRPFGTVDRYTLSRAGGVEISILPYGGIIQSLRMPGGTDVVLGFSELDGYLAAGDAYLGAIVGRYANRIAHGELAVDGNAYRLSRNDGDNHLHGGAAGVDKKIWPAQPRIGQDEIAVVLSHTSA